MIETRALPRTPSFWLFRTTLLIAALALGALAIVSSLILADAAKQELHPADAIIVFGAAEYGGRPSPVFRARLDHANALFRRGLAPVIITTGGAALDPKFSEGGVGHDYLMRKGVPESGLIAETQASDTAESARRVSKIMQENHMIRCIAVSDAFHMFRIRMLLKHQGLEVFLAPRPNSRPKSLWQSLVALTRESVSYLLWRAGLHG
ncbi:MAG: YdcF family protein [Acidobacteria bacterium]|nr:YdcF family protein [Acidobacteriota bacterium]